METIHKVDYPKVVKTVLSREIGPFAYQKLESKVVFDEEQKLYLLVTVGEDEGKEAYDVTVAISITPDGKVIIERDMSDYGIEESLIEGGIEYKDIVRQ